MVSQSLGLGIWEMENWGIGGSGDQGMGGSGDRRIRGSGNQSIAQPSECGRRHTLISVHAQAAAGQQSNGNSEARMSEKCGVWRD